MRHVHNAKLRAVAIVGLCCISTAAMAQKGIPPSSVMVDGHAMASDRDLIDNLSGSPQHSTFLSLLRTAGMVDALQGHGPFTVFAPTNQAFAALPNGMLDSLRRPENKAALVALLSMHILPGNYSSARLRYVLRGGKGQTDLDTVNDGKLTLTTNGPANLVLKDSKGNFADIVIYDAKQANGVLFVTDRVMIAG